MTFIWHHALWLLLALPLIVRVYFALSRRKAKQAVRYPGIGLVREALGASQWIRRHTPPLLFLLGLTALALAISRPAALVSVPATRGTVILAVDVSLSMAVSDIAPTRLDAAKAAAAGFVKEQPPGVRIGVVTFARYASVVQAPTTNREEVLAAFDRLELQEYTSLGSGLIAALLTIDPTADVGHEHDIFGSGQRPALPQASIPFDHVAKSDKRPQRQLAPRGDLSAAIVLISDGHGPAGFPAMKAAKITAAHGIRVYTIGVGTPYGGVAHIEGRPAIHAAFEEETLKEIANITEGEYFHARNADKLKKIYHKLGGQVVLERKEVEVSAVFTGIAALLLVSAAALSLLWCHRVA